MQFYKESLKYASSKITSWFWQHAVWNWLLTFLTKKRTLIKKTPFHWHSSVWWLRYWPFVEELFYFKALQTSELLSETFTDALIHESENSDEYRIVVIWHHFYQFRNSFGNNKRFCDLLNVARLVLSNPSF